MHNVHGTYSQISYILKFVSMKFLLLLMMESNLLPSNEFPSMRLQRAHCANMVSPIKLNHLSSNGIYIKHDNVGTQS